MEFSYELSEEDSSSLELKLNGYFDEFASLPENIDFSKYKSFYIDFSGVDFINSGGIKLWVNFAETLDTHTELKTYFRKCKRIVVDQINLIEGFLPANAEVLSVYVPIFCDKCERSFNAFQDISKLKENFHEIFSRVQDPQCGEFPKCTKSFEVDIIDERFFKFTR